jgi:hypothetical protein
MSALRRQDRAPGLIPNNFKRVNVTIAGRASYDPSGNFFSDDAERRDCPGGQKLLEVFEPHRSHF